MNTNIKATNIELTSAIREYVESRIEHLSKFIKYEDAIVYVEVGKTTNHHKQGIVFKAEIDIRAGGKKFFVEASAEDLYGAIDQAKESMARELTHTKDRKQTLFKRGASSVKKMLKGIKSYKR